MLSQPVIRSARKSSRFRRIRGQASNSLLSCFLRSIVRFYPAQFSRMNKFEGFEFEQLAHRDRFTGGYQQIDRFARPANCFHLFPPSPEARPKCTLERTTCQLDACHRYEPDKLGNCFCSSANLIT